MSFYPKKKKKSVPSFLAFSTGVSVYGTLTMLGTHAGGGGGATGHWPGGCCP